MIERKSGDILIVASTASFQGVPLSIDLRGDQGVRSYLRRKHCRRGEALRHSGVRGLSRHDGPRNFTLWRASRFRRACRFHSSEEVARIGLKGLRAGKHFVICGASNRFGMEAQRILPRRLVTAISERLFRPNSQR